LAFAVPVDGFGAGILDRGDCRLFRVRSAALCLLILQPFRLALARGNAVDEANVIPVSSI
jgi:hypothetical protein